MDEDGIEDAFELQAEVPEKIRTGIWVRRTAAGPAGGVCRSLLLLCACAACACRRLCVRRLDRRAARLTCLHPLPPTSPLAPNQVGDCFIYNNAAWRLNYCVGGEVRGPGGGS